MLLGVAHTKYKPPAVYICFVVFCTVVTLLDIFILRECVCARAQHAKSIAKCFFVHVLQIPMRLPFLLQTAPPDPPRDHVRDALPYFSHVSARWVGPTQIAC